MIFHVSLGECGVQRSSRYASIRLRHVDQVGDLGVSGSVSEPQQDITLGVTHQVGLCRD